MENNFASELLAEVKLSAKRWFIAFLIMTGIEIATIAGFLWYISLPVEDVSFDSENGNNTYVGNDLNGELNNGENESSEASNQE